MFNSKQHAIALLFGATMIGGVLDHSADRLLQVYVQKRDQVRKLDRTAYFEDLGLTPGQRAVWTSIIDSTNCRILEVNLPLRPMMDSIRGRARAQLRATLDSGQLIRFEQGARADSVRRSGAPTNPGGSGAQTFACWARRDRK